MGLSDAISRRGSEDTCCSKKIGEYNIVALWLISAACCLLQCDNRSLGVRCCVQRKDNQGLDSEEEYQLEEFEDTSCHYLN